MKNQKKEVKLGDDDVPENEWWFDLSEHKVTIEYKRESGKWFLVVRRKRKRSN